MRIQLKRKEKVFCFQNRNNGEIKNLFEIT